VPYVAFLSGSSIEMLLPLITFVSHAFYPFALSSAKGRRTIGLPPVIIGFVCINIWGFLRVKLETSPSPNYFS
jgi:hypothetical protein